ncbi:Ras-like without CAAX 1, isoform CRA_b [Mus musculus]|uniref:Ras-like without CAAX 1 n=1 Tax=Mus musculus TaxID=10090 RepID=G3UWE0_MOUSE|nr:Ras-like without CAAX 1, isoform CRA_b [Mus musculus]
MESGARPIGSSCSSPAALSREYKLVMLGAGGVGKSVS